MGLNKQAYLNEGSEKKNRLLQETEVPQGRLCIALCRGASCCGRRITLRPGLTCAMQKLPARPHTWGTHLQAAA